MQLQHIPLDQLKISPLNMRHSRKAPDISDILPSIRAKGIQQPLLVRIKGKHKEIVAGRRRFFSLKKIEKEGGKVDLVPCAIMDKDDDAAAIEASLIENVARCDPDEMTRFETYSRLVGEGRTPVTIAQTFGVTEIAVKRALALGNLLPAIRAAYRDEEIDAQTIRQLTLATKAQQADWFKLFTDPEQRTPAGWQLKQWLFGGEIKTERALFPLNDYKGRIITDLFEDAGYFDDLEQFWKLQNLAIAAKRDAYEKQQWAEIIVLDSGDRFQTWEHVRTKKSEDGRVYIEVRETGEVLFHEGFITCKEHERRLRNTSGDTNDDKETTSRPELTKAAQNYFDLHRHAAVRHALLKHPSAALRLMVAHAVGGSGLWYIKADPQKADKEEIAKSVDASTANSAFVKDRAVILKMLNLSDNEHSVARSNCDDHRLVGLFFTLLKLSDKQVMQVLTYVMAETLEVGTSMVEALGCHFKIDMADCWQPDEIFFDLLRDKTAVNAMLRHIGGKHVADGNLTATAKAQKNIIKDFLSGEGRKRVNGWLPYYMKFPFKAYTKAGGGRLSDNLARIKSLIK